MAGAQYGGGTLLCSGVPKGVTVVLDYQSFDVGAGLADRGGGAWTGVRDLCVGPHFCATAVSTSQAASCFPTGFFFYVEREGEAILREWDAERECLVEVEEEEKRISLEQRLRSDAGFVSGMLRYDPKWRETWGAISSHISRETISRIQPVSKRIGIGGEPDFIGSLGSAAERDLERQLASASGEPSPAPGRGYCREDSKCFYSDVPGRSAGGSSAWGRELTALHMDKTPMLEAMVAGGLGGRYPEVLGELEFAFVSFLMCQSLAGFVAWRNLVGLVLGCEEAHLSARTDFCVAFLGVLRGQLVLAARSEAGGAEGFFGDLVAEEGFLRRTFGNFFEMVGEADVVPLALEEEAARLKETVERTLGISVTRARTQRPDHEEDEYAPVVVDL